MEMKVGILLKDINENIASLRLLRAVESYPRLQNLQYFRRLNDFIENTFNENLEEINGRKKRRASNFRMVPRPC